MAAIDLLLKEYEYSPADEETWDFQAVWAMIELNKSVEQPNLAFYSVNIVSGHQDVKQFSANWRVFDKSNTDQLSYFQSSAWCLNWLQANPNADPLIVAVYAGPELVMVLPLMKTTSFGVTVLETMTGPDAEYSSPAIMAGCDAAPIFETVIERLAAHGGLDLLRLNSVPQESEVCNLAEDIHRLQCELQYSSIIELDGFENLDGYLATRSKNSRRSLRRKMKDLGNLGEVASTTVPVSDEFKGKTFPLICKWKRDWFAANGVLGGRFNASDMAEQLSALCPTDSDGTPALATELRLDGELIACDVMMQRDGHLYSYVTARDLDYDRHGVGTVMDLYTIEHAIKNGYKTIDLLSGPNPSKDSLSNRQVPLVDLRFPLSEKGRWQASIDRLRIRDYIKGSFYQLPISVRQAVLRLKSAV
ncbi:MAG: GNAT family N-acetyltransferase [Pseudomonadota bacterium]